MIYDLFTNVAGDTIFKFLKEINLYTTNNTNKTRVTHKQLEANSNRISIPCGNRNGHHNMKPRT